MNNELFSRLKDLAQTQNRARLAVLLGAAAMLLMRFCPRMFTAIAFDSGGVASGPMASTFILAFMLGVSKGVGGNPAVDAFGGIAMIAMTPLIAIQLLGIVFSRRTGDRS